MSDIKVGDKVRYTADGPSTDMVGRIGVAVTAGSYASFHTHFIGNGLSSDLWWCVIGSLERITEEDYARALALHVLGVE